VLFPFSYSAPLFSIPTSLLSLYFHYLLARFPRFPRFPSLFVYSHPLIAFIITIFHNALLSSFLVSRPRSSRGIPSGYISEELLRKTHCRNSLCIRHGLASNSNIPVVAKAYQILIAQCSADKPKRKLQRQRQRLHLFCPIHASPVK
jgi:hypothetical protein